jgi:hypothetical protein
MQEPVIVWDKEKAIAVRIPSKGLKGHSIDEGSKLLHVRLEESTTDILGDISKDGNEWLFKPVVPFTHGMRYAIYAGEKKIGIVKVPKATLDAPQLLQLYPSADTLPENLLKIYLQFSKPMQESEAIKHIHLINDRNDTIPAVFLDLQPELWNADRTVLTVWLDPGRIKRELIPNQQLGNPLEKGRHYKLIIDNLWRDQSGANLSGSFTKNFYVENRDEILPDVNEWQISTPAAESKQPLEITFNEMLDRFLITETIQVFTGNKIVNGTFNVLENEKKIQFIPGEIWTKGKYRLSVNGILEDVAGNNLNRPFDRDIQHKKIKAEGGSHERGFELK